jgi:hypothetical protein
MPTKKQTFEDREKAAGLFGTTSGYSNQSDNRGTYSQMNSAQANYKNTLENALGGRLTQSQIEKAQRHAGSMGLDFDPNAGYVPKGYGKTPRASSSQRRDSREARSAATGNTISKGGAAGIAAGLGQILGGAPAGSREAELRMKMLFGRTGLTDAEEAELGLQEIGGRGYDNVPDLSALGGSIDQQLGIERMTPEELREREARLLAEVNRQNNAAIGAVHPQLMGYQPINTSGLQGLSMIEKDRLSSQGLLGNYMGGNQLGPQIGSPRGGLMGTSALGQATGGYFG